MRRDESRVEWLLELPGRILGGPTFSAKAKVWPHPDLIATAGAAAGAAAIVSGVAARHVNGALLDDLVEWLTSGNLLDESIDPVAVALDSVSQYRSGLLPDPYWWDPATLNSGLLVAWTTAALRSRSKKAVDGALRDRWKIVEGTQRASLFDEATGAEPEQFEYLVRRFESDAVVTELWDKTMIQARSVPDLADTAAYLLDLKRATLMHWAIEGGRDPSLTGTLFADQLRTLLKSWVDAVTVLELSLVRPYLPGEQPLRELVARKRRQLYPSMVAPGIMVVNGLSDRIGDHTLAADWLVDEIFSAGARSGLMDHGPTAYMWLALETHQLPAPGLLPALGIGLLDGRRPPIDLIVSIGDEDPAHMGYTIGASARSVGWLALLALSKRLVFDVFEITATGVKLLRRQAIPVDEIVEVIRPAIDELVGGATTGFSFPNVDDHVVGGFVASENAKSEILLALAKALEPDAPIALRAAADEYLSRKLTQAWGMYAGSTGASHAEEVSAARNRLDEELSRMPARLARAARNREDELSNCVAGLATSQRAVVHFNYHERHVQGFWVADGGRERGWVSLETLDLPALVEAVAPWLDDGSGDVAALRDAARPLGEELHDAFAGTGVNELVLLPWSLLHAVPFGALDLEPVSK